MNERPPRSRDEFLDLFASYYGREAVDAVVDQLALTRRGGFSIPQKLLVILFASRAGSNYFGQLLCGSGWFREIGESFAPHQLAKIRDRYGLEDTIHAAQWMIDNRGSRDAFGFKAGFRVLTAAADLGVLPEAIDRAQFVLLRRRDRVAQAVSLVKGKLSGRMHSGQPPGRPLSDSDYDGTAIRQQVDRIALRESQYEDLIRKFGKSAPVFYYEDICERPHEHVAAVCDLMDLEMPADFDPNVRLSILRDDLSARWADRYRAESGFEK